MLCQFMSCFLPPRAEAAAEDGEDVVSAPHPSQEHHSQLCTPVVLKASSWGQQPGILPRMLPRPVNQRPWGAACDLCFNKTPGTDAHVSLRSTGADHELLGGGRPSS